MPFTGGKFATPKMYYQPSGRVERWRGTKVAHWREKLLFETAFCAQRGRFASDVIKIVITQPRLFNVNRSKSG